MARKQGIQSVLGKLNPFAKGTRDTTQNQAPAKLAQTATIEADTTVLSDTTGTISITQMTPDQIMQRNYAILNKVSHNQPADKRVMETFKKIWRIIGPIAFIVFTAGEVFYYLKHFLPDDKSIWTDILLWGVTLLIEIPFAIATYDLSGRKERAAEAKQAGREAPDTDTGGAVLMWFAMATINIAGQLAFLVFVTRAGSFERDWPVYLFIGFRVIGVIVGDAYVAFFLSPSPTSIDHVVRFQKKQGEGIDQLTDATIERQRKESRAKLEIERNQMAIERERRDAAYLAEFNQMNMQHAIQQQRRMLEIEAPEKDM